MKDFEEVKDRIKLLSPEQMESFGIVQRARIGYICPVCRDGSGKDGTGMSTKLLDGRQSWYCGKCATAYDNFDLLAAYFGKDVKRDFKEIIELSADLFGFALDNTIARHSEQKPVVPDKFKSFISNANGRLKSFVEKQGGSWRGLSFETLNRYLCGFADCFGMKGEPQLPHFVIPSSFNHCLVRLIGKPDDYPVAKDIKITPKPHWGSKEIFALKLALNDDPIIFLVEGEFDAMSIWQTSGFNVIAISGSALQESMRDQLKHIPTKNFVVLLDNDQTGNDKADLVVSALNFIGHNAVKFSLSDIHKDANDFLQADPKGLSARLKEIYSQAQDIFAKDTALDEFLDLWRETNQNAIIDSPVINDFKAAASFIDDLSPENFSPAFIVDIAVRRKVALLKFYAPQLATKFFSAMNAAQRNAKAKIKELRNQKPPALIPSELQELSDMKIANFENAVNEIVTQIKRNQKDFQKKFIEEQEKRQLEAKRKELLDKQLSTKKIIPDCPVDLFIPESVFFSNGGVGTQSFAKNGDLIQNIATKNPILPVKILREPAKNLTQYEIAIKTKGKWQHVIFDGRTLIDPRKIYELADYGALSKEAKFLTNYFVEMIAANEDNLVEIKAYQQPGWKDKDFKDFAYPTGGDDYIVRRAGFNYQDDFDAQGDAELWKKTYIEACNKGGAIAHVFLGTAFSSPLVAPLRLPNLQCHLYGEPNCGKSGLEILAASAFGNPRELIRTFGATLKNRQAVAAAYNDLPSFLDELETLAGGRKEESSLAKMVYEFFEGKANQANKRDGSARETFKFRGSRVSSAERPLLKASDPQGAFKRLLQLYCKEKLFDDDFASSLHFIPENNFGHFGKGWIDFISSHLTEIKEMYYEFGVLYKRIPKKKKNVEPTLLKTIVTSALSYQYFNVFIGVQNKVDIDAFIKDIDEIISLIPSLDDMDEANRAKDDLQSYVAGHDKFLARENQKPEFDNEYSQSTYECFGKKFDNTEVAILTTKLKTILEDELGYNSADAIIAKWAKKGFLIRDKGHNFRSRITLNGSNIYAYKFKAGVLISKQDDEPFSDSDRLSA